METMNIHLKEAEASLAEPRAYLIALGSASGWVLDVSGSTSNSDLTFVFVGSTPIHFDIFAVL